MTKPLSQVLAEARKSLYGSKAEDDNVRRESEYRNQLWDEEEERREARDRQEYEVQARYLGKPGSQRRREEGQ